MRKSLGKAISILGAGIIGITTALCPYRMAQAEETEKISGEIEVLSNQGYEAMSEYLEGFQKKYPDIDVTYTYYSDYDNEVNKRITSGDYGDVFFIPSSLGSDRYATYLAPLGSLEELSLKYNFLEQSKIKGDVVYGIPSFAYLSGILYNREVFDKAGISELPKSIEEFVADMGLIKEHTDAIPFYTNYTSDWAMQYWESFPYIEMTGNAGYRYNTFLYIENPFKEGTPHYKVYRMLYDLVSLGYCEPDITKSDWELSKELLNEGKIGCIAIGSWAISQFKAAGPNGDNIEFMPFPNTIDGKQYMTVSLDYSYGIAANSENKEAARAYIDYMIDESGFAIESDNLSVVKTDPYPDAFGTMENVVMINSYSVSDNAYNTYKKLSSKFEPGDTQEIKRVMEAGAGFTNERFEDIINDWNQRWESSRTQDMKQEIQGNYYEDVIVFVDNSTVTVSETEQTYIREHPTLRVGYNRNLAPFSYEVEGVFTGLALDLCEVIRSNTGFELEFHGYDNTEELLVALEKGEIDVAAAVEKQSDSEMNIRFSKEYLSYMNVMIKRQDVETTSLEGKRAAAVSGDMNDYWEGIENKSYYGNLGDCIEGVHADKADYTITNYYSANYYARDRECTDLDIVPSSDSGTLHMAFSRNADTTLVALCNKCIYSTSEGNMQVNLLKYMEPPAKPITLKKIVESNPIICIAAVSVFFGAIVIFILIVMRQKDKNNRKHAIDVKRYQMLSELSDEYMFEYDYAKEEVRFDSKFVQAFGFGGTICLKDYDYTNETLTEFLDRLKKIRDQKISVDEPFCLKKEYDGDTWYRMVVSIVDDEKGKPLHMIGKITNVQKEMQEVHSYQEKAERDALTQLYNRNGFNARLPETASNVAFAVLDMDNFKSVNDTLGHTGGDYALVLLARTLEECMGERALLCRYGGDEFMVMLSDVTADEVEQRLQRLVSSMNRDIYFEGREHRISISVGAVYSERKIDISGLFGKADGALYAAKSEGKNIWHMEKI